MIFTIVVGAEPSDPTLVGANVTLMPFHLISMAKGTMTAEGVRVAELPCGWIIDAVLRLTYIFGTWFRQITSEHLLS